MIKSYFTIAWRSFRRNKVTSIINIGGLMLGLTTGIVICLMVVYMFEYDKFHKNYKDIHLLEMNQVFAGTVYTRGATPGPLGPALQRQIPSLKYVVRTIEESESLTRFEEKAIYQRSIYAEPDFFHMMTFPAIAGDPVATLREGSGVVLTQSAAQRLFGSGTAMGKTILINNTHPMKVGAVVRDLPVNSSIQFDLVQPFSLFEKNNDWITKWDYRSFQTWVQLNPGASLESVNHQITQILLKNSGLKQVSVFAYPITRLFLYSNFKDGKPYWGKAYLIFAIAFIAFLTLLIACINFMNLTTAMAEHRAREVGLRKVLGAVRGVIIVQFLGEAMLFAMLALILSTALAYLVLPWFSAFAELPLKEQFGNPGVWILLVAVGLFTGFVAGSYPAFYLSHFQPVKVLKRLMSIGRKGALLRKGLVTFQFFISILLVTITIAVAKQVHYIADRPLGYETSNLIDIRADGNLPAQFDLFKEEVKNIPGVVSLTASSSGPLQAGGSQTGLEWAGKRADQDFIFAALWVRYDWSKTMGLKLAAGRDFSTDYGADSSTCLINETAVKKMGLKGPIPGTRIGDMTVIGVLQDFVFNNITRITQPLIIYLTKANVDHFIMRFNNDGQWKKHLARIEKTARSLNPGYPFTFRFADEEHQQQFQNDAGMEQLANIFSAMAILISCLGLFGLAGFLVEKRTREISIRKVLGASPADLWFSLSKEMLKPVLLGLLVATPVSVMALSAMLSVNDYHIRLSWWIFAVGGVGAVLMALATVSYHGLKATRINPARSLQTE